jgi:hypothetical protein
MNKITEFTRAEAADELEKYGIEGSFLYLVDIIPLIEMIWADGNAQDSEIEIFDHYLEKHVKWVNAHANFQALTFKDAKAFADNFLKKRPSPELLKTLRLLLSRLHNASENEEFKSSLKKSLLAACIDIAASAVTEYPYEFSNRFNPAEKKCFFEIVDSLEL